MSVKMDKECIFIVETGNINRDKKAVYHGYFMYQCRTDFYAVLLWST